MDGGESVQRTIDQFDVGEVLAAYELQVTAELNRRYLEALEDTHPRYTAQNATGPWVHPGLLLSQSNPPKSPSHVLPDGAGHVQAKGETQFFKPGRVGATFRVTWKILDRYVKRQRQYMVFECRIIDDEGDEVLRRRMTTTLVRRADGS
jgi:hypothetical protein